MARITGISANLNAMLESNSLERDRPRALGIE